MIDVPDPERHARVECTPLPVEMVMRAYLTGVTTTRSGRTTSGASASSAATRYPTA